MHSIASEDMKNKNQKKVLILGSTGSIGTGALDVIRELSPRFRVIGLSAGSQWDLLCRQTREFRPLAVSIGEDSVPESADGDELACELHLGDNGLCELIKKVDADIVVGAITGWAGFKPCLQALETGCRLALANKETLVVGGRMVLEAAERSGAVILPVDSEESAIFQAMQAGRRDEVRRVFLTASGGPFHDWPAHQLEGVTPAQALCHPNWDMGRKITIDSATLMNKALEIIETRWLFDLDPDQIQVLIHPQSIVHSMVEFKDGSVIAQLGAPDMRVPIQYALTYPDRTEGPGERLKLEDLQGLELRAVGPQEFPALGLGYEVARRGGTSGAALNAANEVAVDAFLSGRIAFTDIVKVVRKVLSEHKTRPAREVEVLELADREARKEAEKCLSLL